MDLCKFRLWNPERDPAPRYKADLEADIAEGGDEDGAEETPEEEDLGSRKSVFERNLQNYLVQNLGRLEPGLKLYEDENGEFTGVEFPTGQRYIDILAVGTRDDRHAKLAARLRYAPPAIQLGRETGNALTFEVDQSPGAGHPASSGCTGPLAPGDNGSHSDRCPRSLP